MPNDFLNKIKELGYSHEEVLKILEAGKGEDSTSQTEQVEQQEAQTEQTDNSEQKTEQSENQGHEDDKLKSFKDEIMKEVKEEIKNSLKVPRGQNPKGEQKEGHFEYPRARHPAFEGMI